MVALAPQGLGDYEKVRVNRLPKRPNEVTPESKWWRQLQQPKIVQQLGAVTHCEYQPSTSSSSAAAYGAVGSQNVLVTSATRLLLYDFYTQRLRKQFTRFASTAYSGTFRADGKMVAAGSDTGVVQLFSVDQSRDVLRQLQHSPNGKPVRCVRFLKSSNTNLVSCGDDALVKYWDISVGEHLSTFSGHTDYVRSLTCGERSSQHGDCFLTGGYDHKCMLWDVRVEAKKGPVRQWTHAKDAPVEDVLLLPSGTMAVSCGATVARVWDLLSGKLLASLENHQKTVTSLRHVVIDPSEGAAAAGASEAGGGQEGEGEAGAMAAAAGSEGASRRSWRAGPRLLTGSVDGHLKVYELDTFGLVHSTKYALSTLSPPLLSHSFGLRS